MIHTTDVADFFYRNDAEIKKITFKLCKKFGVSSFEDVIQDIYKLIIKRDILNRYDPNHPSATKISTYLFYLIRNVVRLHRKSNASIIERHSINNNPYWLDNQLDLLENLSENALDVEYATIVRRNEISDLIDGLNLDLTLFEKYLKKRDKFYSLSKSIKAQSKKSKGLSLLQVFILMRKGISHRNIAEKFGVSNMFISTLNVEIKQQMIRFGIVWKKTNRKRKEFLTDQELENYAKQLVDYSKK
jgi:hypothetical protein